MVRGTTPTINFTFPSGVDPSQITVLSLVFAKNGVVALEKSLSDVTIDGQVISYTFTEAETLAFARGEYKYQIRFGIGTRRLATKELILNVTDILKDGSLQ